MPKVPKITSPSASTMDEWWGRIQLMSLWKQRSCHSEDNGRKGVRKVTRKGGQ